MLGLEGRCFVEAVVYKKVHTGNDNCIKLSDYLMVAVLCFAWILYILCYILTSYLLTYVQSCVCILHLLEKILNSELYILMYMFMSDTKISAAFINELKPFSLLQPWSVSCSFKLAF